MRRGVFVAPFDELVEPRTVAELAARAEDRGWDGFFVWDHIVYSAPVRDVSDPWIVLAAIACATERLIIGPLVTPIARRRVHKLARETVTLDRLSGGRLVLGAGLGGASHGELAYEDPTLTDPRERARLLDDGLEQLAGFWDGGLTPAPVNGRIPVWLAARYPNRAPVRRAARWDGLFPIELPGPEALQELGAEVAELRGPDAPPFDLVVTTRPGTDPEPWAQAGATWVLTGFEASSSYETVRAAIDAGP